MDVGKDHFRVLDCDNVTTIAPCCGKAKKAKMLKILDDSRSHPFNMLNCGPKENETQLFQQCSTIHAQMIKP